jgi:hypothetical protein
MLRRFQRSLVLSACAIACSALAVMSPLAPSAYVRSADQNGDGRPDIWRTYNRQGQLSHVAVDTNFDGRADVQEYYERGALVRRESDRDFNNRVDLVQDFDPTTREPLRSVVDVDFDGRADLLVLFRDGQPVFSKWAGPVAASVATSVSAPRSAAGRRSPNNQLAPLQDPFRADLSISAARVFRGAGDSIGLSTSGGLPASFSNAISALPSSSTIPSLQIFRPVSATIVPYSPRGPPASSSLA